MKLTELEQRVSTLELKMASLSQSLNGQNGKRRKNANDINAWMDEIHGTFQDTPGYREAARLGRAYRESFRPRASRRRKPRK